MNDTKVSFCSALHQKYASEHLASEYEDVKISFSRGNIANKYFE